MVVPADAAAQQPDSCLPHAGRRRPEATQQLAGLSAVQGLGAQGGARGRLAPQRVEDDEDGEHGGGDDEPAAGRWGGGLRPGSCSPSATWGRGAFPGGHLLPRDSWGSNYQGRQGAGWGRQLGSSRKFLMSPQPTEAWRRMEPPEPQKEKGAAWWTEPRPGPEAPAPDRGLLPGAPGLCSEKPGKLLALGPCTNGFHPRTALSRCSRVQLFGTPWIAAHWAPLAMGFSRQEYWSGLPFPPPGDLPNPGMEPASLESPTLAGRFFATSATWEALSSVCFNTSGCPRCTGHRGCRSVCASGR